MKNFVKGINSYIGILVVLLFAIESVHAQIAFEQEIKVFKHKVTKENRYPNWGEENEGIQGRNKSFIDNELVNGLKDKLLFISHVYGDSGPYIQAPIGVEFVVTRMDGTGGKWTLVSLDGSALELNAEFNILVTDKSPNSFIVSNNKNIIDNPRFNNNPNALFIISQRVNYIKWKGSIYNPHPYWCLL